MVLWLFVLVQVWVSASMKISWLAFQNNIKDEGRKTDLTKPGHFISKSGVGWAALPPKPKLYFRSVAALPLVCHWCHSQQRGTKKRHSSRQRAAGLCESLVSPFRALLSWDGGYGDAQGIPLQGISLVSIKLTSQCKINAFFHLGLSWVGFWAEQPNNVSSCLGFEMVFLPFGVSRRWSWSMWEICNLLDLHFVGLSCCLSVLFHLERWQGKQVNKGRHRAF